MEAGTAESFRLGWQVGGRERETERQRIRMFPPVF